MGLETMVRPAAVCLLLVLAGCAGIPEDSHPLYGPVEPIDYSQLPQPENNGGLYTQGRYLSLFADVRAGQVGDIVSIVLVACTAVACFTAGVLATGYITSRLQQRSEPLPLFIPGSPSTPRLKYA